MTLINLSSPISVEAADGDTPTRTIIGTAVTYGTVLSAGTGPVMFLDGALPLDGPAPKLIRDHDRTNPIGLVNRRWRDGNVIKFAAKISQTGAGDEALTLAADGVLDSVSVGVMATDYTYMTGSELGADGYPRVLVVAAAEWPELSLLPFGADPAAKIEKVAASEADPTEPEPTTDPDPTEPDPSEEDTMTDNLPAAEATIAAPALTLARPARNVTAGQYLSKMLTGQPLPVLAADEVVSDIPGLVPDLLVGSIWDSFNDRRPVMTALGTLAMPGGGESFYRRKVTQHTDIAEQNAEFDTLASQQYQVERIQVDKKWYGGYLNVSEQAQAYSDASLLDLIIRDMARVYAAATEQYTVSFIGNNCGTIGSPITDWTDGDQIIEVLYRTAAAIYNDIAMMPTHLIVDSAVWAKMGAAKDSAGNRIFPFLGPSNAAGTLNGVTSLTGNPLGVQLIVSDGLLAVNPNSENGLLFCADAVEVYEDRRGALRVEQPSTLSTQLAFRGVVAAADIALNDGGGYFVNEIV